MQLQPTAAKLAEITYRSKISKQHLGDSVAFPNEPSASQFLEILKKRLKDSEKIFLRLQKSSVPLSPYLEIGAEYGLASALLENKFKASGFSTDISLHSLTKAKDFAKKFNLGKIPKTICADAYNLPFKSNSFNFVFMYETLHHFPDPKPVLLEIRRVLAQGGVCFIGADPIKSFFNIRLWRRPTKLRFWEKILKALLILPLISDIGKTEVEHGILEEAFPLAVWREALSIFDKVQATVCAFPFGPCETITKTPNSKNWLAPSLITKIALYLLGGGLQALAYKFNSSQVKNHPENNLEDLLICPNCRKHQLEISLKNLTCSKCQTKYPQYKNVPILLAKKLQNRLLSKKTWNSQ
ncbi:class I SAM-dependent methyltransferase [Candidatus Curtissbacteria bacterium]|nr:class I SAM-dependent methyltransferase [Candidatus Curtissbacteria bacterium]